MGVAAAAQLAKLSALAPLLRVRFGIGLPEMGLLVSLLEVGGAMFGFIAGLALAAIGSRRALSYGLLLLVLTGIAEGFAQDVRALFLARGLEAIGYLMVVVASPTMIAHAAGEGATRAKALALWSTFIPIGIGLGSGLTGLMAGFFSLRLTLLVWAAMIAIAFVAATTLDQVSVERRRIAMPAAAVWLLTAGFGCYTLFLSALIGLLPSFLVTLENVSVGRASMVAGAVSLAAVPGAFIALRSTRGSHASPRRTLCVAGIALLLGALSAPFAYALADLGSSACVAALTLVSSGVARTLLFTRVPVLSGATDVTDPRIAAANGLLAQFGAGGALIGPPLGGLAVEWWGWVGFGALISLMMLVLLAFLVAAEWIGNSETFRTTSQL